MKSRHIAIYQEFQASNIVFQQLRLSMYSLPATPILHSTTFLFFLLYLQTQNVTYFYMKLYA